MPGPGNPNNIKDDGGPVKNQINLGADNTHFAYTPGTLIHLDTVVGDKGIAKNKVVIGTDQGDHVDLGGGNDQMWAGDGNDIIYGGDGNDVIRGEAGNDYLDGGIGNDVLDGGEDDDYMAGGVGNDVYHVDSMDDVVVESGGEGDDTVIWRFEGNHVLPANVENGTLHEDAAASGLTGDAGNNVLIGNSFANEISGLGGDDTIFGLGGDDTITCGEGDDTIDGGEGDDTINGGEGDDTITGGNGDDTIRGHNGDDTLSGGAGDDEVRGQGGDDMVFGGEGADKLFGGGGVDSLDAGTGGDTDLISLGVVDGVSDTVVAQATQGDNGSDSVFQYEDEGTHDVFDFSALLGSEAADDFDTFIYVDGNSIKGTNGTGDETLETGDDTTWFTVWEDNGTDGADSIYIEVNGTDYMWDTVTGEWII